MPAHSHFFAETYHTTSHFNVRELARLEEEAALDKPSEDGKPDDHIGYKVISLSEHAWHLAEVENTHLARELKETYMCRELVVPATPVVTLTDEEPASPALVAALPAED